MDKLMLNLFFTLVYLGTLPLYAMDKDGSSQALTVSRKPSAIKQIDPTQIKWDEMNKYIIDGMSLASVEEGTSFSTGERSIVSRKLAAFSSQFIEYFKSKTQNNRIERISFLKPLLSKFWEYLLFAYNVNDVQIRKAGGAESARGAADRTSIINTQHEREPFFRSLQGVTNLMFKALEEVNIYSFSEPMGIIPATEGGLIGFCMDSNGYVPFAFKEQSYPQVMSINWGAFDFRHQKNFVVRDREIITDTGLVLEITSYKDLKLRGYYGAENTYPFTAHRITARTPFQKESTLVQTFESVIPKSVVEGKRSLREREVIFVSLPSQPSDSAMLEILFLEELQSEVKKEGTIDRKLLTFVEELSKESSLEEQGKVIENALLSEYEVKIRAEQEERSRLLLEGKLHLSKKKGKKQKGKSSKEQTGTTVSSVTDPRAESRRIYEENKVQCQKKFKDVLNIIRNVVRQFPEQVIRTVNVSGSHINIHGEGGGFTVVKPHGSKDALPAYRVNRIISRIIDLHMGN